MLVAGLQFVQTIVLARLLLPVEFGLMAVPPLCSPYLH